jgi:hypothetical protein
MAAMMSVANQVSSDEQKKEVLKTAMTSCYAAHLPADHPERDHWRDEALKHFAAAKALGSEFPAPTLDATSSPR